MFALGVFGANPDSASFVPDATLPRALSEAEQRAARPLPLKILSPLLALLFGESRRRRKLATQLIEKRGCGRFGRIKLGWALRRAGGRNSVPLVLWRLAKACPPPLLRTYFTPPL